MDNVVDLRIGRVSAWSNFQILRTDLHTTPGETVQMRRSRPFSLVSVVTEPFLSISFRQLPIN